MIIVYYDWSGYPRPNIPRLAGALATWYIVRLKLLWWSADCTGWAVTICCHNYWAWTPHHASYGDKSDRCGAGGAEWSRMHAHQHRDDDGDDRDRGRPGTALARGRIREATGARCRAAGLAPIA